MLDGPTNAASYEYTKDGSDTFPSPVNKFQNWQSKKVRVV